MNTKETERLIDDYLRRLERAAAHLQRARRAELVAEIRGHIDTALREEEAAGEATVRNVLDRLGPPEEIVDAVQPSIPDAGRRAGKLEIAALVALIVPFLGWLVGSVLVLVSQAWSQRDKLVGLALLFVPILAFGLGLTLERPDGGEDSAPVGETRPAGEKVEDPQLVSGPVELVLFAAGVPGALYLGWRLRSEAAEYPGTP